DLSGSVRSAAGERRPWRGVGRGLGGACGRLGLARADKLQGEEDSVGAISGPFRRGVTGRHGPADEEASALQAVGAPPRGAFAVADRYRPSAGWAEGEFVKDPSLAIGDLQHAAPQLGPILFQNRPLPLPLKAGRYRRRRRP